MLKILWKREEIAPEEQFLLLSTIFCYLKLDFYVKIRIRFSIRDKRLFEITEVEITRVDCMINPDSKKKVLDICKQYNLHQLINQQTHFTETSSTIIDFILVRNVQSIEMFGVREPFLMQGIIYHCPIYTILTLKKPVTKSFKQKHLAV